MAILFRKITRPTDLTDKNSAKKTYPQITYQYSTPSTLDEIAREIGQTSGVSEGESISVLKDFRTLLKKKPIDGRTVNISGLGYFYLAAQSKGTTRAEDFTAADISGLRICFRADKDIRLNTGTATRTDGLSLKDVDRVNNPSSGGSGNGSDPDDNNPGGGDGGDEEAPDPTV